MKTSLRHGDFSFIPFTGKVSGEKVPLTANEFTFGYGEVTGHKHTLHTQKIDEMDWYKQTDGSYLVIVKKEAYATHPEHSLKTNLVVPIGTWIVKQRREKDWLSMAVRKVVD